MSKLFPKCWIMPTQDDMDQRGSLLHAVNGAAEILLTTDEEGFENSLLEAMELIASCTSVDRIYIWQNKMKNGSLQYIQQFEFLGDSKQEGKTVPIKTGFSYEKSIPEWEEKFLNEECVNGPLSGLSNTEQERLEPYGIKSILVIPVHLQDIFWGFVSFDDCHKERTFTEDEVSILHSASLIMASAMDRRETDAKMREADERVKLMLDTTPLCCILWDRNLNIIDCNEAAVKFFGLKDKKEFSGHFFDLSPEYQPDGLSSMEKAREGVSAAFRDGKIVLDWMHQTLDGTLIPTELMLVRVKQRDEYIVAAYVRDMRRYNKMMKEIEYKDTLLHMANEVAGILLTADEEEFENSLRKGIELMARCMQVDRIYIWKNKIRSGNLRYIQHFEWPGASALNVESAYSNSGFSYGESIPEWEAKFSREECVNGPLSTLSINEQKQLEPYGIKSILVIPVHLRGRFWGFVSFDDCNRERTFTEDEVSILRSANLMVASAMDRYESNARIRIADEHTKLMLDATPLCCSLWDGNIELIDCNEAVVNFYGLEDKQEYLDRFFELSPEYQPDGRRSAEKVREYISEAFRKGKVIYEWIHQMPNGELVPAEVTLVRVRRGNRFIVAGYTRDLREHKKMMNAIEYKDTLLSMANNMAGILLRPEIDEFENDLHRCLGMMAGAIDADRMYIWKNHEQDGELYCTQVHEWSEGAEPQQGGKYTVDIPYSDVPAWKKKLSDGQCINGLVRNQTKEEQTFLTPQGVLSILVVPVLLYDQFWGFVGFDDCHRERVFSTEEVSILRSASLLIANAFLRNEMTHDIKAAVKQAQAASKSKSAFLAHMSHEIRTPMNVISGMTELILREDMPRTIYEHVLSIKCASANMLSLINDILDFSKIEAGSLEIASTEYSVTSLINNVLMIIRMRVSEKPILLTTNIDCNIPNRLIGDETRIRQILLNVLDNAVKYTEEGFIALTVTGEIKDDTVVLAAEVTDSGVGIKKDDMHKLFGDFTRVDKEKNKGVQGTGLGLAITRNLCLAMGGDISVSSEYGMGSNFTITIPQKIKSYDEAFASVSDPDTKQVLLYETRPIYADSIVRSLDNLGVRCTLVKTQHGFYDELKHQYYPFAFVSSLLSESAGQVIEELEVDTTLVLLTEFGEVPAMHKVRSIASPLHSATIANMLNDIEDSIFYIENGKENVRFIAPSADILVVDDLHTNLKVAEGLMLPYQMQVDICEKGEEAIECIQNKRYDIIFMDHMMPGMDGIEAASRIRSLEDGSGYYENIPIIALTANAISGVKEMFLQSGMNDFLAKPIDVAKLHSLLERWIPEEKKEKIRTVQTKPYTDMNPVSIQIEGVDVQGGIAMTGGTVEGYLKTLAIFNMDGTDRINKIRDCVEENDIELYTTHVHALKSACANIGAWEISELFKSLEIAGARDDDKIIRANTERVLKKLEMLLKNIHAVVSQHQGEPTEEGDPEILRDELLELKEALNNRDAGEVEDIMNELETIRWNQHDGDMLKEISSNILLINYTDATALVDRLLMSEELHC